MSPICTQPAVSTSVDSDTCLNLAIAAWLHAKTGHSQSNDTRTKYEVTIRSYQQALYLVGLDLDSDQGRAMGLVCQEWAARRSPDSHWDGEVATSTFNNRVAIVSSFFTFATRRGLLPDSNPTVYVERRRAQRYAHAHAMDFDTIRTALQKIDRHTLQGKRDYALLVLGLSTGRRMSELGSLRGGDVAMSDNSVIVTFRRTKGGKTLRDELAHPIRTALLTWLQSYYGVSWSDDAPVWVRLTRTHYGSALGWQSIGDICYRWLGTTKVHTLRHTFAYAMEQQGAKVTEIQQRLGHADLSTTSRYLEALGSDKNRYGETIAAAFGVE